MTGQPGGGMKAVERDVRGLSPAQVALGEVELIQQYTSYAGHDDWAALATKLGNIGVIATRLAVLLDERDAEREGLVTALTAAREVIHGHFCQAGDVGGNMECWKECRAALAALKGAE